MTEETLAAAIKAIRNYTALPAWFAEVLALFLIFIAWRFGVGVWIFDTIMASAAAGSGPASGALSPAAVAAATELGAGLWWPAWLHAYDSLRSYADNAIIAALSITAAFEGGIMFLARKRIRLSKEEGLATGHEAGREVGRAEGRAEERAELQPFLDAATRAEAAAAQAAAQVKTMQAENQLLRERESLRDEEIRLLRERQALRDEENRFLREQLAQRSNGNGAPAA